MTPAHDYELIQSKEKKTAKSFCQPIFELNHLNQGHNSHFMRIKVMLLVHMNVYILLHTAAPL